MLNFFTGDPICPRERMAHLLTVPDSASYWPSSALVSRASTSPDRRSANLSPHPRNPVTNPLRHTSALTDANDHTQSSTGKILRSIRMNKLSSAGNEAVMFLTCAGWVVVSTHEVIPQKIARSRMSRNQSCGSRGARDPVRWPDCALQAGSFQIGKTWGGDSHHGHDSGHTLRF